MSDRADPSDGRILSTHAIKIMLATRTCTLAVWLLAGISLCNAQTPLRDPAAGLQFTEAVRLHSPSDATWTPPAEVHVEDPLHATQRGEMEMVVESAPCACGVKRCPGVCRDPGHPEKPLIDRPGDRSRGDCPPYRYRIPDCKRAGNPHCVAPWAVCSVNKKYSAWFVGGGAAFWKGRCRKPTEGTWGLDYSGFFGHANVWLKYTRGREQGGEGAYETDGEPEFVTRTHELLGLGH